MKYLYLGVEYFLLLNYLLPPVTLRPSLDWARTGFFLQNLNSRFLNDIKRLIQYSLIHSIRMIHAQYLVGKMDTFHKSRCDAVQFSYIIMSSDRTFNTTLDNYYRPSSDPKSKVLGTEIDGRRHHIGISSLTSEKSRDCLSQYGGPERCCGGRRNCW